MLDNIPAHVLDIQKKFQQAGFEIYLVGGCVRDILAGRQVKDWDFTTNATPEQMQSLFPDAFYDNNFGTVGIPFEVEGEEHKKVVEVTTFRTERGYTDRRHPTEISWGKTVEEDLSRRDFTINAMALRMSNIIDPYHGQEDLKNKLIRAVGDPQQRFKEDALRLMRAIRFATQLGLTIEEKTLQAIIQDSALLQEISKERVRDELLKILASDYPYDGIMLLKNTNLLQYILPELLEGI